MAILVDKNSPTDRIATAYQRLSESAAHLNSASDELGISIRALDLALQKLNLGITTWVKSGGWECEDSTFEDHCLGYAKVGPKWGIALRIITGVRGWEENAQNRGEWLFNDAPRPLRAEAVNALPEMIESLVTTAKATTEAIKAKTSYAQELAKTVTTLSQAKK